MEASAVQQQNEHEAAIDKHIETLSTHPIFCYNHSSNREGETREAEPGSPHEAMCLVLTYLPVFELLAMSEACTSLRDAVHKDVLPWLGIIVEEPLSSRLSDDILLRIASKANGRIRTLALMNCSKVTDDGLRRVVEKNPFITELHLPGCNGLTPEGIIAAVKTLSHQQNSTKSLHIRGIYALKKQHLEILCSYLQAHTAKRKSKPVLYYHQFRTSRSASFKETDHIIDLEVCKKCSEVRIVFDCTKETCKKRDHLLTACKGCSFCIPRCEECGGCVDGEEMEETVCSDVLCSDCWLHLPKCNLCNRPYCSRHTDRVGRTPCSIGFACEVCEMTAISKLDLESA